MNMMKGAASAAVLILLFSCAPLPPQSEATLGTICTVNLYGGGSRSVYNEIFSRIREIEERMSINKDGTEVDAVNAAAGIAPVRVSEDVFEVVEASLRYAEISDGAFDPSVGALVKLWGIGSDDARAPVQEEIDAVLPLVNYRNVALDKDKQTIFLSQPGMTLDLGGIAKGYAADEAVKIIKKHGIQAALVDLGGNIFVYGKRSGRKNWRIGVQDPLGERNKGLGVVEIEGDATLVTSGVYERFFEIDGERYHHILSTRNGRPVNNGLLSTAIIAKTSMDADALSTAVFALGYEKGGALVKSLAPSLGVEAIFVFEDKTVRTTALGSASARFTLTDAGYTLE
ncbi:MAG: FAD:protein FMN transferase [Treponema sp.]|jgi:thiamine biosynthesis lipoprotein|nr:FAD:protein FMN transferase [Treponema sp.]